MESEEEEEVSIEGEKVWSPRRRGGFTCADEETEIENHTPLTISSLL
jgi:hypothetical protein